MLFNLSALWNILCPNVRVCDSEFYTFYFCNILAMCVYLYVFFVGIVNTLMSVHVF